MRKVKTFQLALLLCLVVVLLIGCGVTFGESTPNPPPRSTQTPTVIEVTRVVEIEVAQPPVEVTREVSVEVTREVGVPVTREVEVEVTREVEVEVTREVEVEVTQIVEIPVTREVEVEITRVVEVQVFPEYENCVDVINLYINAIKSGKTVGFQVMASRIRDNSSATRYGYVSFFEGVLNLENDELLYGEGWKLYSDEFNPERGHAATVTLSSGGTVIVETDQLDSLQCSQKPFGHFVTGLFTVRGRGWGDSITIGLFEN